MLQRWQLQEAKSKLSEVVNAALDAGPQLITRRGVDTVILISYDEYRQLTAQQEKLSTFFQESPLAEVVLDLHRDTSGVREDPIL